MKCLPFALLVLMMATSSPAQTSHGGTVPSPAHESPPREVAARKDERPIVWPTVRYGWPEKWSFGAAFQPRLPGALNRLIVTGTVGTGGHKVGLGYGWFGGNIMRGYAVQAVLVRTGADPVGVAPYQTYLGVESAFMLANVSVAAELRSEWEVARRPRTGP